MFNVGERGTSRKTVISLERYFYVPEGRSQEGLRGMPRGIKVVDTRTAQCIIAGYGEEEETEEDATTDSMPPLLKS